MVLLKSEGRKSQEIADFLGFCQQAVNLWLNRYKAEGVNGLSVRMGRGRRSILSTTEDIEAVKKAVRKRQSRPLDAADFQLGKFADKWNAVYPVVVKSWRNNWTRYYSDVLIRAGN